MARPVSVGGTPAFVIPNDFAAPDAFLFDVRGVAQLPNGTVVVGNAGTKELFFFDGQGRFLRARGGEGDGPGEFQQLFGIAPCRSGRFAVEESSRFTVFDHTGELVEVVAVAGRLAEGRASLIAFSDDCSSALMMVRTGAPPPPGEDVAEVRFPTYWASLIDGTRDTVGILSVLDIQAREVNGRRGSSRQPFGRESVWSTLDDRLLFGLARDFELAELSRDGTTQRLIRWNAERRPITEGDIDDFLKSQAEYAEIDREEAAFMLSRDEYVFPSHRPAYSRLITDDRGRLWVQRYGGFAYFQPEPSSEWWVFSPDGEWLATVILPDGLDVQTIGHDLIVGVFTDEFDVEEIRAYPVPEGLGDPT